MNEQLIANYNYWIGDDDIVYCLGDFGMGDRNQLRRYKDRLVGRWNLICGNHDKYKPTDYMDIGFVWASRFPIIFNGFYMLSHEPLFLENNSPYANLYGHTHQNSYQSKNQNYYNCCVEQSSYLPIDFKTIQDHFYHIGFKSEKVQIVDIVKKN